MAFTSSIEDFTDRYRNDFRLRSITWLPTISLMSSQFWIAARIRKQLTNGSDEQSDGAKLRARRDLMKTISTRLALRGRSSLRKSTNASSIVNPKIDCRKQPGAYQRQVASVLNYLHWDGLIHPVDNTIVASQSNGRTVR